MSLPARTTDARREDTLARLENDIDAWVATADSTTGTPYLIPLSFLWDGETILLATPTQSPTGQNMQRSGVVRIGLGLTRDVILIEGTVSAVADADIPSGTGDAFAVKTGFDPRQLETGYHYFHVVPTTIQAWREANELQGRVIMRNGTWLVTR